MTCFTNTHCIAAKAAKAAGIYPPTSQRAYTAGLVLCPAQTRPLVSNINDRDQLRRQARLTAWLGLVCQTYFRAQALIEAKSLQEVVDSVFSSKLLRPRAISGEAIAGSILLAAATGVLAGSALAVQEFRDSLRQHN